MDAFCRGKTSILHSLDLVSPIRDKKLQQVIVVEKRVVATSNSDCKAYSFAEFEAFFGEAQARQYWDKAVPQRPSTTRSGRYSRFGDDSEDDADRLTPRSTLINEVVGAAVFLDQLTLPKNIVHKVLANLVFMK